MKLPIWERKHRNHTNLQETYFIFSLRERAGETGSVECFSVENFALLIDLLEVCFVHMYEKFKISIGMRERWEQRVWYRQPFLSVCVCNAMREGEIYEMKPQTCKVIRFFPLILITQNSIIWYELDCYHEMVFFFRISFLPCNHSLFYHQLPSFYYARIVWKKSFCETF